VYTGQEELMNRELLARISYDPKICSGKPCIKGTRIPVHMILDLLAAGENDDGIRRVYPEITLEDIRACFMYASVHADEDAGIAV
jgi:uncharacterized protein (DUF433 family)